MVIDMNKLKTMLIMGFVIIFFALLIYNFREPIGKWIDDNFGDVKLYSEPDFDLPSIGAYTGEAEND